MMEWYFSQDGKSLGPVSLAELQQLAANGKLQPTDLVWKQGMPSWVPASDVSGIFPAASANLDELVDAAKARPKVPSRAARPDDDEAPRKRRRDDDEPPRRRRAEDHDVADRPRRRRTEIDDDEIDDRPRRRRPAKQSSSGAVVLILAIVGGVAVLGILIVAVAILAGGSGATGSGPRTFALDNGKLVFWHITFKENQIVEIRVTSKNQSDVDLFIYDANNQLVVKDEETSKDCYVSFITTTRQKYKVEVQNRTRIDEPWRNGFNSGTVTFTEAPFDPAKEPPKPLAKLPVAEKNGVIPLPSGQGSWSGNLAPNDPIDLKGPGGRCKVFTYPMIAGKTYTIDMQSKAFDSFLRLEDPLGAQVATDDDSGGGLNARIVHLAAKTGFYRIIATSLGPGSGNFEVKISP